MSGARFAPRPGEQALDFDPGDATAASLAFIGRIRTPWSLGDCPKNLRAARETGQGAWIELDAPYRPGLAGLAAGDWLVLLYWMHAAPRHLIVQAPRHRETPSGVFALRSPARPNPVALATVRCTALDPATGRIDLDAMDCIDGTALLDIKPHIPAIDCPGSGTAGG